MYLSETDEEQSLSKDYVNPNDNNKIDVFNKKIREGFFLTYLRKGGFTCGSYTQV